MNNTHTYITNQNESQLELIEKLASCNELNRMLLNLFYTVSHNLNSYASNIKLIVDLVISEDDPIENKETLSHLRTVSNDLNKTILDLSQIVYVKNNADVVKEPLNLNQYLNKIESIINGYNYEKKLTIINKIPNDAFVNYSSAYLESILLNFSTNAIKYAHPDRFPELEFTLSTEDNKQVLTIVDNGLGIDLEKHGDSLFGLNQTFHQHENANGIGLYITKYQIEAMNGIVTVASKVGQGTTFKIYF